jgi:hypothetical protein
MQISACPRTCSETLHLSPPSNPADYRKVLGNRWERPIDSRRLAAVDLLIPSYRSRVRDTVCIGDIVTTEVPGLAEALRRPGLAVALEVVLTDGTAMVADVVLPDAASTLGLKAWARTVRRESRDAEDLWRCLEIAHADGVTPETFRQDAHLGQVVDVIKRELGPTGASLDEVVRGLRETETVRRRTRIRALLAEVIGTP